MNRIFYFTTKDPKLQGDLQEVGTLIGLRNILGDRVIDIPRKKVLYSDFSESPRENLHGRGFTFYDGIEDIDPALRDLEPQEDDVIIYGTVEYGILGENRSHGKCKNVYYIDGGDVPDIRILPCFKRELFQPEADKLFATGFGIPKSHILPVNFNFKTKLIPLTCPDVELMEEFKTVPKVHFHPTLGKYVFSNETDYIRDIATSWFFPITKRGGYDSLRPYQSVAYGTLALFRDYDKKPANCSPQNFPCFSYSSVDELKGLMSRLVVDNKPTREYLDMMAAQRNWLNSFGTCEARAKKIIEKIKN